MKKSLLAAFLTIAGALAAFAQKQQTSAKTEGSNETSASASRANKSINIESGTRLAAPLPNTLDARKARVGDQVLLKTTDSIKSGGHAVVKKGALLLGHVTSVAQKTKARGESQVGLVFDRLDNGSLSVPINVDISSITQASPQAQASDDDTFMSRSNTTAQRAPTSSSGQGGGLLGGATDTVGGVVGGATSTVGATTRSASGTVVQTTSGWGQSLGRIQISESSSTSAEGSSLLTLQGDNLHLEKGTTFNLLISQSASAS